MARFAIDFHAHTRASSDGLDAPERVVAAARDAGLDAIAITDHDTAAGYERLCRLGIADPSGRPVDGFLVIPGVEVSTREGHVLVLGRAFQPRPGITADACTRLARDLGAMSVAAHPFDRFRSGVGARTLDRVRFDAIEAFNSKSLDRQSNPTAEAYALANGLPGLAGSDAHHARCVGRAHTIVDADDLSVDSVLRAVIAGRVELVRAMHSTGEIASYLVRGWLTRPWVLDRAKRSLGARRGRNAAPEYSPCLFDRPASPLALATGAFDPTGSDDEADRLDLDLHALRERRIAASERARRDRARQGA